MPLRPEKHYRPEATLTLGQILEELTIMLASPVWTEHFILRWATGLHTNYIYFKVATNIRLLFCYIFIFIGLLLYLHYTFLLRLVDKAREWCNRECEPPDVEGNIIRYFTIKDY